jgi:hypothetical protein
VAALLALLIVPVAGATVTRAAPDGTTLLDGRKVFPIVLAKGPEVGARTPSGADGLDEVVSAGVTFLKVGPAATAWSQADLDEALAQDRAAAVRGVHTWLNLATLSRATAGSTQDTRLHEVVAALKGDASAGAIGMWKGADEPWWSGYEPSALQFAYCRATSRGTSSWCAGEAPVDSDHLWVTIQAPKGTSDVLTPYSAVTDIHGVDHYPVTLANADPDLSGVGRWTKTLAAATPNHAVWTTLQVCASGSSDGSGAFVLPTRQQERYMIYDAILNGARSLAFYGGNIPGCWNASDSAAGWNWTFWEGVLQPLVREINAGSPLAPVLVNAGSERVLETSDSTVQAVVREGVGPDDLWVIAARSGPGSQPVTIRGLPANAAGGAVYTEGRSVTAAGGELTDTFGRWDVHVYHLTLSAPPPPPTSSPPPPPAATVVTTTTSTPTPTPPPPAPAPAPVPFRLVAGSVSTAPAAPRAGSGLTVRLRVTTATGARVGRGTIACTATLAGRPVRIVGKGWSTAGAWCGWKPTAAQRGKRLTATIRVTRAGSTVARTISRRLR